MTTLTRGQSIAQNLVSASRIRTIHGDQPPRVRQIIPFLDYSCLVRIGVIPDLIRDFPTLPNKRYPGWIYARYKTDPETFSRFGLFMEALVFESSLPLSPSGRLSDVRLSELWSRHFEGPVPADLLGSRNFFNGIYEEFRRAFALSHHRQVEHEPELSNRESGHRLLVGHPDLMTSDWVLEVKTTTGFAKMAEEACLQLLCYWMLARMNDHPIRVAGLLFPLQRQIIWFDLSNWDYTAFHQIMMKHTRWFQRDLNVFDEDIIIGQIMSSFTSSASSELHDRGSLQVTPNIVGAISPIFSSPYVGSHIHKHHPYPSDIPVQIFLSSPQAGEDSGYLSPEELTQLTQKCRGAQVYIHSPYTINLCSSQVWTLNRLRDQLRYGRTIGAQGVVVHVGKATTLEVSVAQRLMTENVRLCLAEATPECPLLIETPAGEGTELHTTLEEMIEFYGQFSEEERKRLKICVDTCHVFVAGYEPAYYLKHLLAAFPNSNGSTGSVGLVHFNDSREPRGARNDSHYTAGIGFIGYIRIEKVYRICLREHIAMVRE